MVFEAERLTVETYEDPVIALPKVICVPPNVLILNGKMPGMHGIEFFLKYREFCRVPVIFLSASAEEIEEHLREIGKPAEAYVQMPCSQRQMIAVVRDVLRAAYQ